MKDSNKLLVGVAGLVLFTTIVGLVIYKMSEEEDNSYNQRLRALRKRLESKRFDKENEGYDDEIFQARAEDEFGIFL